MLSSWNEVIRERERERERESQRGHSLSKLIWTSVMLNRPIAVKFENNKQTKERKKERNEILFSSKNYQHKHFRCLINYTNKSRASYECHRETLCVNFEACLFYTVIHEFPTHFREKHWNVHISFYQCRHGRGGSSQGALGASAPPLCPKYMFILNFIVSALNAQRTLNSETTSFYTLLFITCTITNSI